MNGLMGKVAIVTGSGSGIGAAAAARFGAEGASVVVADLNFDSAEGVAQGIREVGGEAAPLRVDVANRRNVVEMVSQAERLFGGLDILMNNAGVPMPVTAITDVTEETLNLMLNVNLKGVFFGCQEAVPAMRKRGGGSIIMTSALSGIKARPGLSAYAAAKGGVNMLTKSLARELAPDNIRVNAILPVATDTPMLSSFSLEADDVERGSALAAAIPLGRLGEPRDIANAALFFASEQSSFITGVLLTVDGGSAT